MGGGGRGPPPPALCRAAPGEWIRPGRVVRAEAQQETGGSQPLNLLAEGWGAWFQNTEAVHPMSPQASHFFSPVQALAHSPPRGGVEDAVRGAGLHDQLCSQGKCSPERTGD